MSGDESDTSDDQYSAANDDGVLPSLDEAGGALSAQVVGSVSAGGNSGEVDLAMAQPDSEAPGLHLPGTNGDVPGTPLVYFAGQALTPMSEHELLAAHPHSGYARGFVCDGCEGNFDPGGGWTIFHGLDLDLCAMCAEDQKRWKRPRARQAHQELMKAMDEAATHADVPPPPPVGAPWDPASTGGRERNSSAMDSMQGSFRDSKRDSMRDGGFSSVQEDPPEVRTLLNRFGGSFGGSFGSRAMMLYEHSGRHGFDDLKPDLSVPTPPKVQVCAMLKRETQLRNAPATQRLLDLIDHAQEGEEERLESLGSAQRVIDALRAELRVARWFDSRHSS